MNDEISLLAQLCRIAGNRLLLLLLLLQLNRLLRLAAGVVVVVVKVVVVIVMVVMVVVVAVVVVVVVVVSRIVPYWALQLLLLPVLVCRAKVPTSSKRGCQL